MRTRRALVIPVLLATAALVSVGCQSDPPGQRASATRLESSAVAVPEPLAADVGADVLRQGGNAVDAAIAVQFALAVTFPVAGNIGGGGFMLVHDPDEGEFALDYRETAPLAAHRDLFLDESGDVVPGLSLRSHLAAGVPGTVRGMWEAHQRFGSLPWARLVEPAARLAEEGFVLDAWTAGSFERARERFSELPERYRRVNNFAEYFRGEEGDLFQQRELAAVLRRIAEDGSDGFYAGETARAIVAEMERGEGIITERDLAAYEARWREPISGSYRGHRIVSMSPPSSGGIALVQMLNMLELYEPPERHTREHLHLLAEIEKRVFADRAAHLGDTDYYPVAVEALTSKVYARQRAAGISLERRSDPRTIAAGRPVQESEETTHFTIVDRRGMAVSNTTTLNAAYGTGIVVRGAGFLLNDEMDDFSAKPGVPNLFGVTGGEANKVEPGKRMLSSMSPTLVFDRSGRLWFALGTPGGPTIITSVFQVIANKIDYGMNLEEAVASPRFHHQWPPRSADADSIRIETREAYTLPPSLLDEMRAMGYAIEEVPRLGDVQAVEIVGTRAIGIADPRLIGRSVEIEHQP